MLFLLLTLIFIRPLIASVAFAYLNSLYLYALMMVLAGWLALKGLPKDRIAGLKLPIMILIAGLVISFAFSSHKLLSAYEFGYYCTCLLLLIIVPSLAEDARRKVILSLLLSGLTVSVLAIYQYFFGFARLEHYALSHNITDSFVLDYLRRRRVFFPFVTPNALAGFLIMIIPLALIKRKYLPLLIPLTIALILTQSLGAMLSLFLAYIFYLYLQGESTRKSLLVSAGIVFTILAVMIVRFLSQGGYTHPSFSTLMRFRYWQDTLFIIFKSPITGTGMGNFNLNYSRFAHNSYLQFWAENGLISIVSIIWLVGAVLKKAIGCIGDSLDKNSCFALLTAILAFLLHNLIDFTFFLPEVSMIWWVMLGLLL